MSEFFDEPDVVASSRGAGSAECTLRAVGPGPQPLFPPTNSTSVSNGKGVVTNITSSSYADRHFVIITQTRKFGSLLTAWTEDRIDGLTKTCDSHVLLGKRDDELLNVFANQIMQRVAAHSSKPLLLSIALDEDGRDPETFKAILEALFSIASW